MTQPAHPSDLFEVSIRSAWGDTWEWVAVDHLAATEVRDLLGRPNLAHLAGRGSRQHGAALDEADQEG
jgi:hypothetical protein